MTGTPLFQRAMALTNQGKTDQAIAIVRRTVQSHPADANAVSFLGVLLFSKGDYAQSEFYARKAVDLIPGNPAAQANLGSVLVAQGKFDPSVEPLRRSISLRPDDPQARLTLAIALSSLGRITDALEVLHEGIQRAPDHAQLLGRYAHVVHGAGRIEEALLHVRRAVALDPADLGLADCHCALLNYAPGIDPAELLAANQAYGRLLERRTGPPPPPRRSTPRAGPLRVGFISPDLRSHSVAYVIESFLEHADRSRLFLACYSSTSKEDAVTQRLRSRSDLWRSIAGQKPRAAAGLIARDDIDVLIDLAGHTGGHSLEVMAMRPAPVQMTYAGWPGTTGVPAIDFRITDTLTDPPGAEQYSTEQLLRLDPCAVSYRPPSDLPPVPAPAPSGGVTFACFGAVTKFNDPLIALWVRILGQVPGSRLLIKHLGLSDPGVQAHLADRFSRAGLDPSRIELLAPSGGLDAHLAVYNRVDISLDTFPYNGTVTICESLLMNVPVVTMSGTTTPSRVSRSLLTAIGRPDLCAHDADAYASLAIALASDRDRLDQARAGLPQAFLNSPICDGPGFARRLTDAICDAAHAR